MADHEDNIDLAVLHCRQQSEKRWTKMEIDFQKVKDDIISLESQLNKQAVVVKDIQELSKSVALLASNMDGMLKEQQRQNERLQNLENKPMKRFDGILDTVIKLIITAVVTMLLVKIGLK